jgi:hypothetical protein
LRDISNAGVEGLLRADQCNTTARDHAFFNGVTGGVQRAAQRALLEDMRRSGAVR